LRTLSSAGAAESLVALLESLVALLESLVALLESLVALLESLVALLESPIQSTTMRVILLLRVVRVVRMRVILVCLVRIPTPRALSSVHSKAALGWMGFERVSPLSTSGSLYTLHVAESLHSPRRGVSPISTSGSLSTLHVAESLHFVVLVWAHTFRRVRIER
jgi:hypothetical protein